MANVSNEASNVVSNEIQETNSEVNSNDNNYYVSSKLDRDKMYAEMIASTRHFLPFKYLI